MKKRLEAFKLKIGGKSLDYRLGQKLDLDGIEAFFKQKYKIKKLWSRGRHILGRLGRDKKDYFLKLATTEGISAMLKNEYIWNEEFNRHTFKSSSKFCVPKNYQSGYYKDRFFYLITARFDGNLLWPIRRPGTSSKILKEKMREVIEFSEYIQKLQIKNLSLDYYTDENDYRKRFVNKTASWLTSIPKEVAVKFNIGKLLFLVESGASKLEKKPRHGDFTPWHLMILEGGQWGLIDGEHAMAKSVEGYDICYFIQRVFSVLKNPRVAKETLKMLSQRGGDKNNLRTVLAARGIGGYLDESLRSSPDYTFANEFKEWVLKI